MSFLHCDKTKSFKLVLHTWCQTWLNIFENKILKCFRVHVSFRKWEQLRNTCVCLENNGFSVSMFSFSAINNNVKFSYAIFHLEIKIALGNSSQLRVTIRLMKWLKQGHQCRETTLLFQAGALTKQSIFILGAPGPSRHTEQITASDQAVYFQGRVVQKQNKQLLKSEF